MKPDFETIASVFQEHQIKFILIGGWAAALHGSARSTMDVDVVYARDRENIRRLAASLQSFLCGHGDLIVCTHLGQN